MNLPDYLQANLPRYLNLLQTWVETNSFTANPQGVNTVGDLTAAAFADLGFVDRRVPAENPAFGAHRVLTRVGSTPRKVGLISHLDTVFPPEEEQAHDFSWRIEGDRIYGPGTNDIKGGTLTILMLLEALQRFARHEFEAITWVILLNAAEETLSDDFGTLCRAELETDGLAALVFEAGLQHENIFRVVTSRKGMATYRVRAEGKASHAGSNHAYGANAIVQLARTVDQIAALTNYEQNLTFNVGVIEGGTVTNRVPHRAEARGEMRAFNPQVYEAGLRSLLSLQGGAAITSADGYACRVEIEIERKTAPWPQNPGSDHLVDLWQQAAAKHGWQVFPEARGGLSDGNHLWGLLPTLDGLGPHGEHSHCSERSPDGSKDQEFVSLASFIPKTLLNYAAVRKLIA